MRRCARLDKTHRIIKVEFLVLAFTERVLYIVRGCRTLSSVGSERTPHTRKVAGSTPAASTLIK